jgi:hypothetical protein
MLGRMQINAALAAERERERTTRLRHIQAAYLCFSDVLEDLRRIGDINTLASGAPQEVARLSRECAADLERLVIHELPAYLASPASNCKGMLRTFAAAIERLESFTAIEHGYIQSDAARIRRAVWRGQSLAWAALGRMMTEAEMAEERRWRAAIEEHRKQIEGR